MDLGLNGKRALVLASSRGLGFGIARALATEGASIILVGRDQQHLAAGMAKIRQKSSGTIKSIAIDLSRPNDIDVLLTTVDREFGGIDILVNNTGGPPAKPATAMTVDDLQQNFATMVTSLIRISGHFLTGMRERKWGRILSVASSGVVQPIANLGLSNTLRAALLGWSKTLSNEVAADGVTVNVIVPGRIQTERVNEIDEHAAKLTNVSVDEIVRESKKSIPAGRYGTVEEFGAVAAFLASTAASYITGSIIRVDGGFIRSI